MGISELRELRQLREENRKLKHLVANSVARQTYPARGLAGTKYWDYAERDLKRVTSQGLPFFEQVLERIRALPGVVSACAAGPAPPGWGWGANIEILGREPQAEGNKLRASYCEVSLEFFETLEIPLPKGRYLSARDVESSP